MSLEARGAPRKASAAAKAPSEAPAASETGDGCELISLPETLAGLEVAGSDAVGETYPFAKLFEADFLQKHPSVAFNAPQRGLALIRHFGTTKVVDPVYKVRTFEVANLFHGGIREAGGAYIEDQFAATSVFVERVKGAAQGQKSSQALVFFGPPGTGKTLLTTILTNVNSYMAMNEATPEFHQFSYRWQNLNQIVNNEALPATVRARLSPFVDKFGSLRSQGIERSPPMEEPRRVSQCAR